VQARLPVRARPGKSSKGNKRRRSAGEDFCGARAPTKEGLEGPERARTIRQDSSQKASQTRQGQGVRSSATAPPGPHSRPRQRTPFNWLQRSGNQGEPREPAFHPVPGTTNDTTAYGLPPTDADPAPGDCGMGGPPRPTTRTSRPRRRTARGDRPRKTGHPRAYSRRSCSGTAP